MNKLIFIHDWVQPEDAHGDDLRCTWAKFSLQTEKHVITRVYEKNLKTVNDFIYLPLYPLAEWLVYNFWFLLNEQYTPGKHEYNEYESRHNLKYAQEGYSLPDMHIRPIGDIVRVRWKPIKYNFRNVEFIESGDINIDLEDFKCSVFEFLHIVVTRLEDFGITDTVLQKEWDIIQKLDDEEREFCNAASAVGVDPFNVSSGLEKLIIESSQLIPSSLLMDFFVIARNKKFKSDLDQTIKALELQEKNDSKFDSLVALREKITNKYKIHAQPWNQGYLAAQELRQLLGVNGNPISDINELGKVFKLKGKDIESTIIKSNFPDAICALSGSNLYDSPSFVINKNEETSNMFTLCRSFYNYFFSDFLVPSMITKTRSTIQKTNRAFAAEFIFPASTLRSIIEINTITRDDIQKISSKYNVSTYLIEHQIENNRIAEIEEEY